MPVGLTSHTPGITINLSAVDGPRRRLCVTCATLPPTGYILSRLSAQTTVERRQEGRQSVVIYS